MRIEFKIISICDFHESLTGRAICCPADSVITDLNCDAGIESHSTF